MGYWNETCLLSRLPIQSSDPCVGLFIAQREIPTGLSYSDSFATPLLPPFRGEYDDFGHLENLRIDANDDFYTFLARINADMLYNMTYRKAGSRYIAVNITDIKYLMTLAKDMQLYVRTKVGKSYRYQPVYFIMMHAEFFDLCKNRPLMHYHIDIQKRILEQTFKSTNLPASCAKELAAFQAFTNQHRIAILPTIGAGSQYALDDKRDMDFYLQIHEKAIEINYKNRGDDFDDD